MAYYHTATGRPNRIVARDRRGLRIQASRPAFNTRPDRQAAATLVIQWSDIREAVQLLVVSGMVDRKALEAANRYSSAVMGLLVTYLPGTVRVIRLRTGRLVLRLAEVRVYIGGAERDPAILDAVDAAGGAYIVFSYYHLRRRSRGRGGAPPAWRRHVEQRGMVMLLDSGAFSLWRGSGGREQIALADYIAFIRRHGICRYLVLDVVGDPADTRANWVAMRRQGLDPIPVFHYGQPWAVLDDYTRQGCALIALGGHVGLPEAERRRWLAEVFRRYGHCALFHGLGIGSLTAAVFPFFSVDATTYLVGRGRPSVRGTRGGRVLTDHGQLSAAVGPQEAVRHNIRWCVRLGRRNSGSGVQLTLGELLEGRVALPH